jgi:hypothetical protein
MWDPAWKPGKSTLATFDSLPRHAALAIPALHEALPIFELLIRKAPRRARYSFVLVQFTVLSTTPELALEDLAAQLRRYVTDHKGMAACTGTGEFAILVDDVDAMDEEDPSMNQLGRYIGASWRESTDKPDIMFTAAITDVSFITPTGDLMLSETVGWSRETLMDYEEYRTPASPFSLMWAPSGV